MVKWSIVDCKHIWFGLKAVQNNLIMNGVVITQLGIC